MNAWQVSKKKLRSVSLKILSERDVRPAHRPAAPPPAAPQVYRPRRVWNPDPFRPKAAQHAFSQLVAHGKLAGKLGHVKGGREPHTPFPESGVERHRRRRRRQHAGHLAGGLL